MNFQSRSQNESVLFCAYIYQLINSEHQNAEAYLAYLIIVIWLFKAINYCYTSLFNKHASSEAFLKASKEFEQKASNTPELFQLHAEATKLLNIFKSNSKMVYEHSLHATKWTGKSNTIYKMILYDGKYVDIKVHVLSEGMEETSFHNHTQHMMLCNLAGDYFHTSWNINYNKPGVLYKFKHEKGGKTSKEPEMINGTLEYVDTSNYQPGNWRCLNPSTIHTIKAGVTNERVISFIIRSKLDQNKDRFIVSKQPKLDIKPDADGTGNVFGDERIGVLKYIVSAVQ
mmetsp:Transcript_49273/g.44101  ORF Transcript_49273/g.44101 Transcript_49273/m.44101 type:complete len:285 (+) Transcript_49273:73-927(+)